MNNETGPQMKDRHILIAVDQSESSKRAVLYVADFLGGVPGFKATVMSVIQEPEEDFFENEQERDSWTKKRMEETDRMLENYRRILIQSGFPENKVQTRSCVAGKSLAELILEFRCEMDCCTVVVARHHKSRTEEFLFGSTSSSLVHKALSCAVWVVE